MPEMNVAELVRETGYKRSSIEYLLNSGKVPFHLSGGPKRPRKTADPEDVRTAMEADRAANAKAAEENWNRTHGVRDFDFMGGLKKRQQEARADARKKADIIAMPKQRKVRGTSFDFRGAVKEALRDHG